MTILIYFILVVLFVALTIFQLKTTSYNFIAPPNLFTIYWTLLIAVGVGLYLGSFSFGYISFGWIFLMCAVYFLAYRYTGLLLEKWSKFARVTSKPHFNTPSFIASVFYTVVVFVLFRVLGVLYYMHLNEIGLLSLVIPSQFLETLNVLTQLKYHVIPVQFSNLISVANTLSFTGLLLFGYYFFDLSRKQRIICSVLAAFSFAFSMIVFASKADLIFAVLIFVSTFLVRLGVDEIDVVAWAKLHKKIVGIVVCACVALLVALTLFIVIRSGFEKSPIDGLKQYGFGMIPAFDYYFDNLRPQSLSFGKYTFLGIWDFFGLGDPSLPQGVYELVDLGEGNYPSNIFTAFRSLIDDFGLFGCFVVFAILGGITAICTEVCKRNKTCYLSICALSFIVMFLLNSFLISVGNYFSLCVAYGFLYVFLVIAKQVSKHIEKRTG